MSRDDDCVYSVNVQRHSLILAPPGLCHAPVEMNEKSKYFMIDHCSARYENDAWDYVQVKRYNNNNHLYCHGNNITISGVEQACPNRTFVLPSEAGFIINGQYYKVGEYQLLHNEQIDPLFTLKANMHFQPSIHHDHVIAQLEKRHSHKAIDYNEMFSDWDELPSYVYFIISGCVLLFVILILLLFCMCRKCLQKKLDLRDDFVMTEFSE